MRDTVRSPYRVWCAMKRTNTERWADGSMHIYQALAADLLEHAYCPKFDGTWGDYVYWNVCWGDGFMPDNTERSETHTLC